VNRARTGLWGGRVGNHRLYPAADCLQPHQEVVIAMLPQYVIHAPQGTFATMRLLFLHCIRCRARKRCTQTANLHGHGGCSGSQSVIPTWRRHCDMGVRSSKEDIVR